MRNNVKREGMSSQTGHPMAGQAGLCKANCRFHGPAGVFAQIEINHLAVVFYRKGMGEHVIDQDFLLRHHLQGNLKSLLASQRRVIVAIPVTTFDCLKFEPQGRQVQFDFRAYANDGKRSFGRQGAKRAIECVAMPHGVINAAESAHHDGLAQNRLIGARVIGVKSLLLTVQSDIRIIYH